MPLSYRDRAFLRRIDRLKLYLVIVAAAVLVFLVLAPDEEMRTTTSVIGMVLCGIFWLTQRLLSYISELDQELEDLRDAVERIVPEHERYRLTTPEAPPADLPPLGS